MPTKKAEEEKVEKSSKKSTKNLIEILAYDNYELYLESNYKP